MNPFYGVMGATQGVACKFLILVFFLVDSPVISQTKNSVFTSSFVPRSITFNASDNPNECVEAVLLGNTN